MDTNKIRQLITELESDIKLKTSAISVLKALLSADTMGTSLSSPAAQIALLRDSSLASESLHGLSSKGR